MPADGKAASSGGAGLATAAMANAAAERRYDLLIGRIQLKGATLIETVRALTGELQRLKGTFDAELQSHGERMGRGAESLSAAAVAMLSEKLGGANMPSLDIWDPAFASLDDARRAIRALSIEQAAQALQTAGDAYRKAHVLVAKYDGALETGGDRAVTTLRVTAAAGAVAAGVATGGIATAAGAGVVGTAGVGAATAGAYGATQELASQGSEVYLANTRRQIDWKAVLRRGASDAATGLVSGLVGGALTKQFSKMFGSYLGKAISDAELAELGKALGLAGPLERTFFMTTGQKFIAEFLSGAALVPVNSAITLAINRISGGAPGPRDMEEFMSGVAHDVIQGGIFQLLVTFLTHKMPPRAAGASSKPPGDVHGDAHGGKPSGNAGMTKPPIVKPSAAQGHPPSAEPAASQPTSHPNGQAPAAPAVKPGGGKPPPHESGNPPAGELTTAPASAKSTAATEGRRPAGAANAAGTKAPSGQKNATESAAKAKPLATATASETTIVPAKAGKVAESTGKAGKGGGKPGKGTGAAKPLTREAINRLPGMRKGANRLDKANLSLTELGLTQEAFDRMANENPKGVTAELNRLIDIRETHAANVEPKGVARKEKVDAPHAEMPAEKKWTRIETLGKTPGKRSTIGKQVIERMRSGGNIKGAAPSEWVYHEASKKWFPIDECHMGHTHDAVKWWNSDGMFHGAKSDVVRKWMNDPAIYELEPGDINSGRGGALPDEYVAPHPDPITASEMVGKVKKRK